MVGDYRVFCKGVREESSSVKNWWKNPKIQVGSLSKEFSRLCLW
jgi:hypothetical protein